MADQTARAIGSVTLEARVVRADGTVEELGTLAEWHRNPLKRLIARLRGRSTVTFHQEA